MIVDEFIKLTEDTFDDPGWMREFYDDIVKKNQYMVSVDEDAKISAFVTYWKFGKKRWGYIRKCQFIDKCPKQMGKGKHLYIPLFFVRKDRRGMINVKSFIDMLKRECPDATTLSWHDETGRFVTYKLIRRQDNGNIQEKGRARNAVC